MSREPIFKNAQCENCNEETWVKPWNGHPSYCGVCGHDLGEQRASGLSSFRREVADD